MSLTLTSRKTKGDKRDTITLLVCKYVLYQRDGIWFRMAALEALTSRTPSRRTTRAYLPSKQSPRQTHNLLKRNLKNHQKNSS